MIKTLYMATAMDVVQHNIQEQLAGHVQDFVTAQLDHQQNWQGGVESRL
jgi:hypothetical protein